MSTTPLTRTQRRVAEMRRNLIEIAEELLIEGGMAAVTAEEIARRADISLQTVYNRIGKKPAILIAVAERAMEENRAYIDVAYDGLGSPEERALRVFTAYAKFAFERPQQFRILANPPEVPDAIERIAEMARGQIRMLSAIIRDGIAAGRANPNLDPEAAAYAMWAMVDGMLCLALRNDALRPQSASPEALIQAAWSLLESGFKVR